MDADRGDAAANGAEGGAIAALTTVVPTPELDGGGRGGGGGSSDLLLSKSRGESFSSYLPGLRQTFAQALMQSKVCPRIPIPIKAPAFTDL